MKPTKIFVCLLLLDLIFVSVSKANEITIPLKDIAFQNPVLRGIEAEYNIKVPIPNRFIVKDMTLHIEIEKSPTLLKERSYFSVFWNNKLTYQSVYNPLVDIVTADIKLPTNNLEPFNDLKIRSIHHYCLNCCEFEGSPELWAKIDLENSYIKIVYDEKPILQDTLLIRDYVLDMKNFNPVRLGMITEDTTDKYLELASKLAGYIGSFIRYRRIFISYHKELPSDRDVFIIGTKSFIKNFLNLQNGNFPDIYIIPNPNDITKAVVLISGDSLDQIEKNINNFIKVKNELFTGRFYQIYQGKNPEMEKFESNNLIPLGKKVYFYDLGYDDIKVAGLFPPPAEIEFNIPVGVFVQGKKKILFHFAYNYGAGAREDSVINIYLNDKYVTSLKMDKKYGIVLKEEDIKIPAYLLVPGKNKLKIEYAMMPPGGGFCITPNLYTLRGTIFSQRSYIQIPKLPLWFEMPYLEFFVSDVFPYSINPDLKETAIYLSEKDPDNITSLLTLSAYMGTKVWTPFLGLTVTSDISKLKDKDIIALGKNLPLEFYKNSNLKISEANVDLKYPILKLIEESLRFKISGNKEKENKLAKLTYQNALTNQVFYIMAQSPYNNDRTITIITSENIQNLPNAVYRLFFPKYAGTIKGDVTIWDFYINQYFSDKINPTYFIGHMPFFEKLLYEFGYSPTKFILGFLAVVVILSLIIKKLLDIREKKRLGGEI
jgi:hypothetical protein